jgi:regulatory protein YycI of two-component signal transduction system YycFG
MVIITLSQLIDEKISPLKELMNHKNNKPQVNRTYQTQIDIIKSIDDYNIENVESIISRKKQLLKNSKDIKETDRLLAEIDALEWLQAQIVVLTLGNNKAVGNGLF